MVRKFRVRWGETSLNASTLERNLPQNQDPNDKARAKIGRKASYHAWLANPRYVTSPISIRHNAQTVSPQKTGGIGSLPNSEEILIIEGVCRIIQTPCLPTYGSASQNNIP